MIITYGKELITMVVAYELDVKYGSKTEDAICYLAEENTEDDIERMFESSEEVLEDPK